MYNFKKNNQKGFTLAELLIVIAIIAALVAIMIPTFGGQIEKAREATDMANLRAAYAEVTNKFLSDGTNGSANGIPVDVKQTKSKWQSESTEADKIKIGNIEVEYNAKGWNVYYDNSTGNGEVKIENRS